MMNEPASPLSRLALEERERAIAAIYRATEPDEAARVLAALAGTPQ